jgi:methylase of polypeptide subunit release factors
LVLPLVFSPAIFTGSAWLTKNVVNFVSPNQNFLEIGTGCGVTSIEVSLQVKNTIVNSCDINEQAVANARLNANNFKTNITIKHSDVF